MMLFLVTAELPHRRQAAHKRIRAGSTYTALGGSNTCDHPPQKVGFQTLVFEGLLARGQVTERQNSCIHAMGPAYPSACLPYFVSRNTSYATIEYVPNMGEQTALHLEHLRSLIVRLQRLRVVLAMVNIVPRDTSKRRFQEAHLGASALARSRGIPLIVVDHRPKRELLWNTEERVVRHLNLEGHKWVAMRVLAAWEGARARGQPAHRPLAASTQTECIFGASLRQVEPLGGSHRFALLQEPDHKGVLAYVASEPNATLRLCLRRLPPSFLATFAMESSDWRPMSNVTFACEGEGCSCAPSTYVGRTSFRATQNWLHRVTGHTNPPSSQVASRDGCSCIVTLRNTRRAGDGMARVRLNGYVAGAASTGEWANTYHLGFLRNRGHFV